MRAPNGVLLYGPPDPARRAFVSALAGDLRTSLTALAPDAPQQEILLEAAIEELPTVFADRVGPGEDPAAPRPLIVAQSDEPWSIDPELFGEGRLDRLVFVAPPDWEARRWRLRVGAAARGLSIEQHIDELTAGTNGWTGADIGELLDVLRNRTATPAGPELLDAMATVRGSALPWLNQAREFAAPGRGHVDDLRTYLQRFRLG